MKYKYSIILLFSLYAIISAQSFYNKNLYGYNGKVRNVTSYLFEKQNFKNKLDLQSYKSKTVLSFNELGELFESKRDIKSSNRIYSFKSEYISKKDEVLQLNYDFENKLTDSISYIKSSKNLYKINGKKIGSAITTTGEQSINEFGRDLSSKYIDYEKSKVVGSFSHENILENNLIIKSITKADDQEIIEFYEYSNFDANNNPQKIVILDFDKRTIKKVIIREFKYY